MTDLSTVGKRLRYARSQKRLRQQDVASALGVHNVEVSRWERDEHLPNGKTLIDLGNVLAVPVSWLLRGAGDLPVNEIVSRGTVVNEPQPEPTTPEQAVRRVRAIAARLEADLHEWGATQSTFDAMRIALATEDNVRMFRDGFTERPADLPGVFRRYSLFAEALRETLRDRVEKLKREEEPE